MPRLLLVKFGAIGDCIMTVPAAYELHRQGWEIDWVCAPSVAAILRLYPWINVISVDDRRILQGRLPDRILALLRLWKSIIRSRYDLCATLYYDSRYRLLTLPVSAPRKVLLSKSDRDLKLIPGRHHTDEYARILLQRPDDETLEALAPVAPPAIPEMPRKSSLRVALVPGGAKNLLRDNPLRRWPVPSYVAVAQALLAQDAEVLLCGGPEDTWVLPSFQGLAVTDYIGKFSLVETLSLLDSADATVTHDTGPLHMAGITGTSIVALFGPTDPHNFCPQRPDTIALWGGETFACRPCYDGRDFAPCSNNGCVQQITPALVLQHLDTLLAARRRGETLPMRVIAI